MEKSSTNVLSYLERYGVSVRISEKGLSTSISPTINSDKNSSLEALRQRLFSTLNRFPEASDYYFKATNQSHSLMLGGGKEYVFTSSDPKLNIVHYAVYLVAVPLCFLSYYFVYRKRVKIALKRC